MFLSVLKNEFKNFTRDKMYGFFIFFTLVFAGVSYFLNDYLSTQFPSLPVASYIATMFIVVMEGFIFGAITGFTILDDRDDSVLLSLRVSPINVRTYIIIKLSISYILGVLATWLVLVVNPSFDHTPWENILFISLLSPLQGPVIALIVNALATNKVEGFVIMKLSGLLLMIPVAVFFISNWTEIFLMIIPGFWVARLISLELIPGSGFLSPSAWYVGLGFIVNGIILVVLFKWFVKRTNL